jgi:hypothetical protein
VRRAQAGTDHGLHLRAELDLDLVQPSSREQLRNAGRREQLAFRVQQRGNLVPGGERPPAVAVGVADEREMDPERDLRSLAQQPHRRERPWARHHQAARTGDPVLDRLDDRGVDRVVHPEVVGVDDEHASIGSEAQQLTGPDHGRRDSGV